MVELQKFREETKRENLDSSSNSASSVYSGLAQDADKIPFEGPEARYFRNALIAEDDIQPFRHCNTVGDFIRKFDEISKIREMGFGLPVNKMEWFLYAPSSELYPHAEYVPWRMQEEQTMGLHCIGRGTVVE